MGKRLFVGNLSFRTTEDDLKDAFAEHGTVVSANIITDRDSGRSRGFGFVEMETDEEANTAIAELNEKEVSGRNIRVSEARERQRR